MKGNERRKKILEILKSQEESILASDLADQLGVSRQVIVQDIALLRSEGLDIIATRKGYFVNVAQEACRVFKVLHGDDEVEKELNLIVDQGGVVRDVFIYHKVYGVVRAGMDIKSRRDVANYMKDISSGKSSLLKNVTSGYHYHTITAESEEILDLIHDELKEAGFLADILEYEPMELKK